LLVESFIFLNFKVHNSTEICQGHTYDLEHCVYGFAMHKRGLRRRAVSVRPFVRYVRLYSVKTNRHKFFHLG